MNGTATTHPPEVTDKAPTSNAMLTAANKTGSPSKCKIPTSHAPRATQGDASNNVPTDEPSGGTRSRTSPARRSSSKAPISAKKPMYTTASATQKRQLETQYITKKKRYVALSKEIADKQKVALNLYEDISQLREKVIACGAKDPGKVDELRCIATGPSKVSVPNPAEGSGRVEPVEENIVKEFVANFGRRLSDVLGNSEELCKNALQKYDSIISWMSDSVLVDPDIMMQMSTYEKDNESLKTRMEEMLATQRDLVERFKKHARDLDAEYENCRSRLNELSSGESPKELQERLKAALEELQTERERSSRRGQAESHLQKARAKIRELESHVASDEARVQQLQANAKSLETQIKLKDQAMEQRVKDMNKAIKNSEGLVAKMEKQRDSFESRLLELKEKMNAREAEAMHAVKEINERMEVVSAELIKERERREQADAALAEIQARYKQLEEKSEQLCELGERATNFAITDGSPTENEVCLFAELQTVRSELDELREKACQLQREKEEIVAVMHRAASREGDSESSDKLAAELVAKSAELQQLTIECAHHQQIAAIAHEKNAVLERQLTEIQSRLHAQAKEGGKTAWSAHAIQLQQQLCDLGNTVTELAKRKRELETALTQKQLELEQRERVMREQSKFLQVRDELLGMVKRNYRAGTDGASNDEGTSRDVDQVEKQIAAKSEAVAELYASLESKQMQVMHLEKMVKQMEDQQDRAQAQRTRLENRIAQLELALQEKARDHRSRGFGIL